MILLSPEKRNEFIRELTGVGLYAITTETEYDIDGLLKAQLKSMVEWLKEFDRKHHSDNGGNLFCSACEDEIWEALEKEIK